MKNFFERSELQKELWGPTLVVISAELS